MGTTWLVGPRVSDFFFSLLELTDQGKRDLERVPKVDRMVHAGLSRDEYEDFLHNLYHIVWHFCPAMAAAASLMDESLLGIRDHLFWSIAHENGHHRLVLDDVSAIGGSISRVKTCLPHPAVRGMIAYNYNTPARCHPAAILGMLYTLEVVSSVYGGRVAVAIARQLGMDADGPGFTFLSSHATMDQDHMARLNVTLKAITDPKAQGAIVESANTNWWFLQEMMQE